MIKSYTELSNIQKVEYQKIRTSINDIYKDEERNHYFVDLDDLEYNAVFLNISKASFENVEQLIAKILKTKNKIYAKLYSFFGDKITIQILRLVERLATDDIKILLNSTRDLVKDNKELLKRIDEKLNKKHKPLKITNSEFKKLIKQFRAGVINTINKLGPLYAIDSVLSCYKEVVETNENKLNEIKRLVLEQFYKQTDVSLIEAFFRFTPEGEFKYKMSSDPLNKHQFVYIIYQILVEHVSDERLKYKVNNIFDQLDFII
ncbi:20484_t:CDS:1 [Dentiscutata erythropus]|uniref:20484_t:CDS:1 n=1 Tax=Dentiscutata erythropus TaxID=1348616 RepID=A0A9N9FHN4_9GLOM|nr:20484_t:CDS:1 [Dentiscutata erythropus]